MEGTILVTGATGNVGAAVVDALPRGNGPVVAAVRDVERARHRFGDTVEYVPFDFRRPDTFGAAFAGVRRVFLVRPPDLANVPRDIAPALVAAAAAGVEHVVFLSLLGVERNRIVPHHRIERLLRDSGMAWTFLRASYFMQNLDTTHRDDIREHGEVFLPAGRGRTSFIDVRDVAAVGVRALTEDDHEGRAYPLTGGEALDYDQVALAFTEVLGRPIRYANPSPLAFVRRMRARGLPLGFILLMLALYTTARLGLAATVTDDTARLLGRPPIALRQYIADYRQSWL
jgi:uncharacterized protein YbjT (DUF2867 family)